MDIKQVLLWLVLIVSALMLAENWRQYQRDHMQQIQQTVKQKTQNDLPHFSGVKEPQKDTVIETSPKNWISATTDLLRLQFDPLGASLVGLDLLAYKEADGKPVTLFQQNAEHTYFARSGLVAEVPMPNHRTVFRYVPEQTPAPMAQQQIFTFVAEQNQIKTTKIYTVKQGSYNILLTTEIENLGTKAQQPEIYFELLRDASTPNASYFYSTFTGPALYSAEKKFQKLEFSDIEKNKISLPPPGVENDPRWISMIQHYFVSAWIPSFQWARKFYAEKLQSGLYRIGIQQSVPNLAPGETIRIESQLFAGPQIESLLSDLAPGLELVKDYGWLTIIAKPVFWLLEKFYALLGNWGWAIIALTCLIKLLFFPLSATSYRSMAKMKKLQPKITALREQHQGNSQQMNQAMMNLYRQEKVNPLGGCLPILIQIPVFITLYWVLLVSVEMRGAPWVGWIHDLSVPDPFYILPLIMAVTMLLQIKLNPSPPDPLQAKIMIVMQLGFSIMFFFFSAGLVLYWVVNNILSVLQQWQMMRLSTKAAN